MVKPGVFSVDKKQVDLKQGQATVEHVHVEVKTQTKSDAPAKSKGCTGSRVKRVIAALMLLAVLVGIVTGIVFAVKWSNPGEPCNNGDDVEYPDHSGEHDGHHGNPGDHDGHHGNPGDHDGHHGNPGDHDDNHDHGGNNGGYKSTERPPPIDYIGTRPPQHPTEPMRPRTEQSHHPTQATRPRTEQPHHPTRGTRPRTEPYRTRPSRRPRTRPPHHHTRNPPPPTDVTRPPHHPHDPPHHLPHHPPHHPPHDGTRPPHPDHTRESGTQPLFGRPDGHEHHDEDDTRAGAPRERSDESSGSDSEDLDHPQLSHSSSYKGMGAWKADHADQQRRLHEARMRQMTRPRQQHAGHSQVELEEERLGYDYGHSQGNPRKKY